MIKTIYILIIILSVSCGLNNRKQAAEIIEQFEKNNVPDKRETVFNVNAVFQNGKLVLKGEISDANLKEGLISELKSFKLKNEISLLPDSTVNDKNFALVNLSAANLRAAPGHSSELVTQALLGTPVRLLKKRGGWYLIQTPDHYVSWVDEAGILRLTETDLEKWRQSERIIFSGTFTQIYKTDKMEQPLADVSMGGILEVREKGMNFINVKLPDGRTGYVSLQEWLDFSEFKKSARPDSSLLVDLAKKFAGRPYLWGGTSCLAVDCSGFTKMVYFMHGIILARDASLQVRHGQSVLPGSFREQLQPGDLLFFGRKENENQPERITHVAISLGKSEYIHAAGMVRQNSFYRNSDLYSEEREKTFVSARRVIGSEGTAGLQWIKQHPWY
jgi:gamma-D-glutamyl-L-lysine dipeptidyl-peptidase